MRTKLVGLSFVVLGGLYFWSQHQTPPVSIDDPIFQFEKQELTEVVIHQPTQDIHLVEKDGEWRLLEAENEASTTMVNRSKHQLHNLTARSIVDAQPTDLEVYGLGMDAIQVDLKLRDGRALSLKVGDPNPTGVSYYMMPLNGPHQNTVVTVAKASVDFFASELGDFRAEHFVQFDLDGIDQIEIELSPDFLTEVLGIDSGTNPSSEPSMDPSTEYGKWIAKRSTQEEFVQWEGGFVSQSSTLISKEFIRRLLGRMLALKAVAYKGVLELSDDDAGLKEPIARIELKGNNTAFSMMVGNTVDDGQRIVQIGDMTERVITRSGFLDEFKFDPNQMRNRLPLEFLGAMTGLQKMTVLHKELQIIQPVGDGWTLNEHSIAEKELNRVLEHCATFRIVEWVSDSKDLSDGIDASFAQHLLIDHTFGTVRLDLGTIIERNVALSDTDLPQVVQYRRIKIHQDLIDESEDVVVLIEENWWTGLIERFSVLQSQTINMDGAQ